METKQQHKKLLIITYYWPPAGGPGVQRWLKFVKYLPEFNIEPIIITVDEKFATYPLIDKSLLDELKPGLKIYKTKTFEFFSVYQKLFKKQDIPHSGFVNEGSPSAINKIIRFIRSNLFIPDPRKGWNRYAYKKAVEIIKAENIKYLVTTSPPHSTQLIGLKLKKHFPDIKWVSDLRDPWTDIYYYDQLYHSFISQSIDRCYEKKVVKNCDSMVVVGESMQKMLMDKYSDIASDKIQIISNGYDPDDFVESETLPLKEFTITYTGTLAWNYDISGFIQAIKQLINEGLKIRIRFVGNLSDNWANLIKELELSGYIDIFKTVPHKESIRFLKTSHLLLLVIPRNDNNKAILTGKIFEYIAVKKPIIGIGPIDGDAANIINKYEIGKVFSYDDSIQLREFIFLTHKEFESGVLREVSEVAGKYYTRKNLTGKLVNILKFMKN